MPIPIFRIDRVVRDRRAFTVNYHSTMIQPTGFGKWNTYAVAGRGSPCQRGATFEKSGARNMTPFETANEADSLA